MLTVASESIDYIICQEGIEHIPNQLKVLEEFNRVLKKDGVLLITTPNNSHFRARLSHFLFETDIRKKCRQQRLTAYGSQKATQTNFILVIFFTGRSALSKPYYLHRI